ncbi:hypothetical protein SAMN05518672_11273 [Chitinophaga sp. CF118]|nr:hypothetical protein SAMN05518672_11273 [Chitinophaga sp. CF118]
MRCTKDKMIRTNDKINDCSGNSGIIVCLNANRLYHTLIQPVFKIYLKPAYSPKAAFTLST